MNSKSYLEFMEKFRKVNKLWDKEKFLKWNNSPGPKFKSIKAMKEYEEKLQNKPLMYPEEVKKCFFNKFSIEKDNFHFLLYTTYINEVYSIYLGFDVEEMVMYDIPIKTTSDKMDATICFEETKEKLVIDSIDSIIQKLDKKLDTIKEKLELELKELTDKDS